MSRLVQYVMVLEGYRKMETMSLAKDVVVQEQFLSESKYLEVNLWSQWK